MTAEELFKEMAKRAHLKPLVYGDEYVFVIFSKEDWKRLTKLFAPEMEEAHKWVG